VETVALRKFTDEKIGKNIKEVRLSLRMSQAQFGNAAGNYSQDTVAKWESGQVPHALVLKKIAEIANPPWTVDRLLGTEINLEKDKNLGAISASEYKLVSRMLTALRQAGTDIEPIKAMLAFVESVIGRPWIPYRMRLLRGARSRALMAKFVDLVADADENLLTSLEKQVTQASKGGKADEPRQKRSQHKATRNP
jgi:transcriptional regulator with XRE-family HTH domain